MNVNNNLCVVIHEFMSDVKARIMFKVLLQSIYEKCFMFVKIATDFVHRVILTLSFLDGQRNWPTAPLRLKVRGGGTSSLLL